jgi:hypothetical protein
MFRCILVLGSVLLAAVFLGCGEAPRSENPAQKPLELNISVKTGLPEEDSKAILCEGPSIDSVPLILIDQSRLVTEPDGTFEGLLMSLTELRHPTDVIVCPGPNYTGGYVAATLLFSDNWVSPTEHLEIVAFLRTGRDWRAKDIKINRLAPNVVEVIHSPHELNRDDSAGEKTATKEKFQLEKVAGQWQVRSPTIALPMEPNGETDPN